MALAHAAEARPELEPATLPYGELPEVSVFEQRPATDRLDTVLRWPDDAARDWTLGAVEKAMTDASSHQSAGASIAAVVVTGSAARDVEFSDDLDLVFIYRERRPQLSRPPISIDLRGYRETEVTQRLAEGHDYLSWAVRYGRVLFEREGWWSSLRAAWNDSITLPSVAEAGERAEKARRLSVELREAGDEDAADELQLSSLTHACRAELSKARVFPKSRPELDGQLHEIGQHGLADQLAGALQRRLARQHA